MNEYAKRMYGRSDVEIFANVLFRGTSFGGRRGGRAYVRRRAADIMPGGRGNATELAIEVMKKWVEMRRAEATEAILKEAMERVCNSRTG